MGGAGKGYWVPNTKILNTWNMLKCFQQVNLPHFADAGEKLFLLPACLGENSLFMPGGAIGMSLSLWIRDAFQVSAEMPPQHWFTVFQCFVSKCVILFGGTPFPAPISLSAVKMPSGWQRTKDFFRLSYFSSGLFFLLNDKILWLGLLGNLLRWMIWLILNTWQQFRLMLICYIISVLKNKIYP